MIPEESIRTISEYIAKDIAGGDNLKSAIQQSLCRYVMDNAGFQSDLELMEWLVMGGKIVSSMHPEQIILLDDAGNKIYSDGEPALSVSLTKTHWRRYIQTGEDL